MTKKVAAFIVLTFLTVPFASLAQSPAGAGKSIEELSSTDIADDSITVLSTEETGVAGYVRQQYAFNCFGEVTVVDYYGAPLDPNDATVLQGERQMCSQRFFGDDGNEE